MRDFMDVVAPGLLLAQGIGRWGNWWNQEGLYGKPTDQPWGVKIDFEHRVSGYENSATFQPTFLFEFIYDIVGVGLLLLLDRRFRFRPPALFASTSRATRPAASSRSRCGSTRRTTSPGCG